MFVKLWLKIILVKQIFVEQNLYLESSILEVEEISSTL